MAKESRTTIFRVPEDDPDKAPIENRLEVSELSVLGPDIFTNTRPPWHPPGARGIYGGAVIAQSLAAAQMTVPGDFLCHSCHCYFLLAGSATIPIIFHVERVRDGRSFVTRTVQARQKGACIFTTTVSFAKNRNGAGGADEQVRHAAALPEGVTAPSEDDTGVGRANGPVEQMPIQIIGGKDSQPHERTCHQWMRCRGKISEDGGHQAHLNALAYMSDSYFIGTVTRIHGLWRFGVDPASIPKLTPDQREKVLMATEFEGMGRDLSAWADVKKVGMLVSLDHSIYFHEPARVRADEWMFTEMVSPWAGEGRGVVTQRIFARDGTLLATCSQEGVVRLQKNGKEKQGKI